MRKKAIWRLFWITFSQSPILILCEPELLEEQSEHYRQQVPANDLLFCSWEEFQKQGAAKEMTFLEVSENSDDSLSVCSSAEAEKSGSLFKKRIQ